MPLGVPTNVEADGYNGTAMEVWWDPVPDTRLDARGKILGYQVGRVQVREQSEEVDIFFIVFALLV